MKVKALTKMFAAMATLVLLTGTITPAGAAMQAVSPGTNPFGFPLWYQDTSGLALELCLDNNPFCNLLPDAAFIPANPLLLPGNFPVESFYMIADSILPTTGGKNSDAKLRLALEATFATGTATLGQQITFLLVNLQKMDNLPPSTTCTVTHPYGTFTFTTDSLGTTLPGLGGQGFRARDPITPVPGVFSGIVGPGTTPNANIGPFLRSSTGFVTDPISGNVYISSAFAALTTVTGSPAGNNFFSIDCPNIGGPGINHVQTNLFNLSGKVVGLLLTPPAVTDFGVFKLGSPSPVKTFTVQNLTGAALIPTLTSSNPVFSITPGTCGAPVVANGTCTFDVTFTPAANGAQSSTITVSSSGLPSATSIVNGTGDGVAPTLTFDPVISFTKLSTQTISGTVTDNNGVGSVQVTVNGVAQTPITAPAGTTSFIWTKLITLPTANGINSISVTASDTAQPGGNLSATQTATITNDTINPVVSITTPAAGLSNNRNPNLSFIASDTNLAFTTVTVDNVGVTPVPATLGPLADGLHTVRVDAGDSAGNSGT
ncbi:MAG TPA: choice-of-anchor D domain-containing protein, partial [Geobacteraceae bacterium]